MHAEMRKVRVLLEEARRPEPGDVRYSELVRAMRETVRDKAFTTAELVEYAGLVPALREAIVAAVGALNPRRIGKLLRRIEGHDFDGVNIIRIGADSSGVVWGVRVSRVSNPQTRTAFA